MKKKMSNMYCPSCKMNVLTVREDIDISLIILLFIFTAGIGVLIYLAIYHDKEANRCVHCKSLCQPIITKEVVINSDQSNNVVENVIKVQEVNNESSKFCFNCGTQLDNREERNYCPFCGTNIK